MVDKMEPCPFCGNDDPLCYPVEEGSKIYRGGCGNADCILFDDLPGNYTSQEHFASWWNLRPTPTQDTRDRVKVLEAALGAAIGYMMNARIDLETGCTKVVAIKTISGGIARARTALGNKETDRHG